MTVSISPHTVTILMTGGFSGAVQHDSHKIPCNNLSCGQCGLSPRCLALMDVLRPNHV